jgi:hypothetical protein
MLQIIDKAKMFREIVNEMADLYEKKNANYGDSFGQLFDALGPISGLVPLHNKLDRATSLIKGNKNNFESLEDTFKDMACYAIMNLMEMKLRNQKTGEQGELTTAVFVEPEKTKEKLDLPEYNSKDGKWYYKGQLASGWCYNKDGLMTGEGYSDGCPVRDMVYRTYDCTSHHFVSNDSATLKISEPIDFTYNPNTITTVKDPCVGCPWNQNALFGTTKPYIGDTPCQWCEHGTKITCSDTVNYCTSTTIDNTDNIKIRATSSIGLDEAFVKADPSIVATTMIDEYYDIDDLTIEEMAEAEREERAVWENIYGKYLTKRGSK